MTPAPPSSTSSSASSGGPVRGGIREAFLRDLARDRTAVRERSTTLSTCVVGAPDLGKAWVVERARREAEEEGFATLLCKAERDEALTPLSLFRGALASWHQGRPREDREETSVSGAVEISSGGHLELSSLLLGVGMTGGRDRAAPAPPSADAQYEYERLVHSLADPNQTALEKRSRLLTEIRRFLVDRAGEAPLLLALEDLQLADHSSADLVAVLLEWRPEAPLWLLLTYTDEEELYPPLRRALERTFLSETALRRPLAPLTSGELHHLLEEDASTRTPVPSSVLDEIVRRAQGLPGVAQRLLRSYQTQGSLPREPGAEAGAHEVDPLAHLTEPQERALALTAVAGPTASFDLLKRAAGEDEERMAEHLEELVQRGILVERPGGGYAFAEEEVREKVYGQLTAARRRVLHRKIGEALEASAGARDAGRVFALARHFTQGQVDQKALAYLQSALDLARGAGSLPRERELLEQSLLVHRRSRLKDTRGEALLLRSLGSVDYALGDNDRSMQELSLARDLLVNLHERGSLYAGVLLDLSRVTERQGNTAVARSLVDEALLRFQDAQDQLGVAWVRRVRARLYYGAGEYEKARGELEGCLASLREAHAPRAEIGRTLTAVADVEFMIDPSSRPRATKLLEEGIADLLADGDKAGAVFAELGRAAIEHSLGDDVGARSTLERSRRLLSEIPEVGRLVDSMLRKAGAHARKGELKEALALADTCADQARLLHDAEREGRSLLYATDFAWQLGNVERAERSVQAALVLGREARLKRLQAEALFRYAVGMSAAGNTEEARSLLAEGEEVAQGQELSRTASMIRKELHETLDAKG